jgi:hypothetical protein
MPTRLRDATDANFDPLNNKNKHVMKYNSTSNSFEVVSVDTIIPLASTTSTPEDFITQLEQEIDVNNINFTGLDAGSF